MENTVLIYTPNDYRNFVPWAKGWFLATEEALWMYTTGKAFWDCYL